MIRTAPIFFSVWLSLVERPVRVGESGGSNPPTLISLSRNRAVEQLRRGAGEREQKDGAKPMALGRHVQLRSPAPLFSCSINCIFAQKNIKSLAAEAQGLSTPLVRERARVRISPAAFEMVAVR